MYSIKANSITNLSDGRYFATFAEWIGFCFDPADKQHYIAPNMAQSIKAWLAAPRFVAECGSLDVVAINDLVAQLPFDNIQTDIDLPLNALSPVVSSVIRRILVQEQTDYRSIVDIMERNQQQIAYFLLDFCHANIAWETLTLHSRLSINELEQLCQNYSVIVYFPFTEQNILPIIHQLRPAAIALASGTEEKVGIRLFDDVAALVEQLEMDSMS